MRCFSGQKTKKKMESTKSEEAHRNETGTGVQSTPRSFRSKVRAVQNAQRFINSNPKLRSSHPSYGTRNTTEDANTLNLSPTEPLGGRARSAAELRSSPIALPLPSPEPSPNFTHAYRLPLPLDLTITQSSSTVFPKTSPPLRSFTLAELSFPCLHPSPDPFLLQNSSPSPPSCPPITLLNSKPEPLQISGSRFSERSQQSCSAWLADVSAIARLHGPHLCKLVGFCAEEGSPERILVYEKLHKGSLDNLLFGASDFPTLDWPSRVKIAYGAAHGLTNLHDKCSEQVLYNDFGSSNIQVDADNSSKLSGYRFVSPSCDTGEASISNSPSNPQADAYLAPETINRGEISQRSNVWGFGIVLLEILTGRQNMDPRAPKEERNLVKWTKPFLMDEGRLFLIMDTKLQGRFPSKGIHLIAELALQCLQNDPEKRPSMRKVLEMVKLVQEMRYNIRFSWKEPTVSTNIASASIMSSSPSPSPSPSLVLSTFDKGISNSGPQVRSFKRSPTKFDLIESPPLRPLIIPPRSCSTTFAREESLIAHQKDYSSGPLQRVQGF